VKRPRVPGTRRGVLYVLPPIPDDLEPAVKDALALRNAATTNGRCPSCGAVGELALVEHGIFSYTFRHEHGCDAVTDGDAA
jgi:hypothetical protein